MSTVAFYIITDKHSGRFYIGSTENIKRRLQEHKYELKAGNHHNRHLQDLYNSGAKLKIRHVQVDTIEKARELEDIMLKQSSNNPKLLNFSLYSSGGSGLNRNNRKEHIVNKIKKAHKLKWNLLPEEEKQKRISIFKEVTTTPEAREKRSRIAKEYFASLTPEQRKPTQETIEKRRKALIGQIRTNETRNKIRLANTGYKHTEKSKQKMSISKKKYYAENGVPIITNETRENMSLAQKGKIRSEETKQKISLVKKEWQANRTPEERKHSEEAKLKISEKHKGKTLSEDHRNKLAEAKRKRLALMSPEEIQAFKDRLAEARRVSNAKKKSLITQDL